jgi:DNA-binding transcriptional ArsR family regulator
MNSIARYNPKSHAPSVYIPCWLIQIPTSLLSTNAKMLYGRLAQWSNEKGDVYRSAKQLSSELGTPQRTIERHLNELRDVGLIYTHQVEAGSQNHFIFLHHEWMDMPIHENLSYKSTDNDQPPKMAVPTAKNGGTPPPKMAVLNKKEIKEIKRDLKTLVDSPNTTDYTKDDLFLLFYNSYPNKQKPRDAHRAFKKLKPTKEFVSMLCTDVATRVENNWKGRHKNKIPHPATYLNSREWEGEIIKPENKLTSYQSKSKYKTMDDILGNSL